MLLFQMEPALFSALVLEFSPFADLNVRVNLKTLTFETKQ